MTILGIAGSLRENSFNRSLIDAAADLVPDGVELKTFDLAGLPFYNQDLDADGRRPEAVLEFARALREADAVLIATPEYNHVIPGVLGNALDWASRSLGSTPPLRDKPVAVVGASPGMVGTARAQDHLKLILMVVGARVLGGRGVLLASAGSKIRDGVLEDDTAQRLMADLLRRLTDSAHGLREAA